MKDLAKINLNLTQNQSEEYTVGKHYENNYKYWRNYRKVLSKPFFMVPTEIIDYASVITSRAMSLYLYYCYRANNETGKSWPSIELISDELDISPKSVHNWNKELESLGLISRVSEGKSSKTTYLLPISDYFYFENDITIETFLEKTDQKIDGNLTGIFHLFQWRKGTSEDYTEPYNVTCLVFKRSYIPDELNSNAKQFEIIKAVFFEEEKYKNIQIDKKAEDFSNDQPAYIFETEERLEKVPTKGIAVTSMLNLKGSKRDGIIDLIRQLTDGLLTETLETLPTTEIIKLEEE